MSNFYNPNDPTKAEDSLNKAILNNTIAGHRGTACCVSCGRKMNADNMVWGTHNPLYPADYWCHMCAKAHDVMER